MGAPHLPSLLLTVVLVATAPSPPTPAVIRLPTGGEAPRACAAPPDRAVYDRPVISIVTHPGDGTFEMRTHGPGSYIAASYV
jgi:gamma-glutamyl hydrolase